MTLWLTEGLTPDAAGLTLAMKRLGSRHFELVAGLEVHQLGGELGPRDRDGGDDALVVLDHQGTLFGVHRHYRHHHGLGR